MLENFSDNDNDMPGSDLPRAKFSYSSFQKEEIESNNKDGDEGIIEGGLLNQSIESSCSSLGS